MNESNVKIVKAIIDKHDWTKLADDGYVYPATMPDGVFLSPYEETLVKSKKPQGTYAKPENKIAHQINLFWMDWHKDGVYVLNLTYDNATWSKASNNLSLGNGWVLHTIKEYAETTAALPSDNPGK